MEWLDAGWLQGILIFVGSIATLYVIPNDWWARLISLFGEKVSPIGTRIAQGADALGTIAEGAGLEKVGVALHEISDVIDEAEDVPRLLAEYTKDGDLTAEEIKKLFKEVGEVGVEGKDFYIKVIKKSE